MKWQKTARIAIAIGVVVFTAVVFVALRRNRPPAAESTSPRTDLQATFQSTGRSTQERTNKEGKVVFGIVAEGHVTYPDGRTRLRKARLTLPDRGGRTLQVSSEEMDITSPKDKPGELETAVMNGSVRMTGSDGLEVSTATATYDERDGILKVPGEVQFSRGRLKGSGLGATYDQRRDVLWLLKDARVSVAPDEQGKGALEGSAASAGFARAEHYLRLTGSGKIAGDGRNVEADDITIQLSEDDRRMRSMQLRGNSRIVGSGSAPQNMAARDIDLTYGEDGKALQHARLTEGASVDLPGSPGAPGRRITARTIVIGLAPDGATVTSLNANEAVQVELPAEGDASARRITASSLAAGGTPAGGLQTATFIGNVEYRETRAAGRSSAASERVATSQRLIVETKPGFGALQQADFRGNVRFQDGATTGEAPRAIYRVVEDTLQLSPSKEDAGPPPRITDGKGSVEAQKLTLALATRKLSAETNVRSSLKSSAKSEGRSTAASGTRTPRETNGKLPSMLKADEPVFVSANRLEYDGTASAVYSGDARLFQGQTSVQADTIALDDRSGNMTATGHVRTHMFFEEVDPQTKVRKQTPMLATSDVLVYDEAKRLATYTTGPTANAHINGPQGDVTADTIQLFLKPAANELDRAVADSKVVVKEGQRHATGDHLTYTADDETYTMRGKPLQLDRRTPTECTRTEGITMTFRRGDDTLTVNGIPGITPFNTKPIPCGPGLSLSPPGRD